MRNRHRLGLLLISVGLGALLSWWAVDRNLDAVRAADDLPTRILPFAPNLVEGLFALGHGDRVVAVPEYTVWPSAAMSLPRVGGILDPNLERISALQPDLLVVQGENPELRRFARDHALATAEVKMDDDLAGIWRGLARLDSLAGGDGLAAAALVDSLQGELSEVRNRRRPNRPRCLLVLARPAGTPRDLFAPGAGSFLNDLMEWSNAVSWTAEHPRPWAQIGLEGLVADPPDVILELRPGEARRPADDLAREWAAVGLADVRVEQVTFDGAMIPGPRVDQTLWALVEAIWP